MIYTDNLSCDFQSIFLRNEGLEHPMIQSLMSAQACYYENSFAIFSFEHRNEGLNQTCVTRRLYLHLAKVLLS